MPSQYNCPGQADWARNLTIYQVLEGPGVFLDATKPTRISEISDGTSKTIAVAEGLVPVPWTSTRDLSFRPDQPFLPWEVTHPGGFNATFVDGSVRFHKRTIPDSELKAYATRSGGEK
jgi:prepilin-type processing-associated H-X9-DG protein